MNKVLKIIFLFVFGVIISFFVKSVWYADNSNSVNVYGWYGIIPFSVFKDFEKETGIRVVYDVYDNNDTLEAQLLATNKEYDVVFPSFIPYAARQSYMGAYKKIDYAKIPNVKNNNPVILNKVRAVGGNLEYIIPFFWGTIGIAINKNIVYKALPNVDVYSYNILFDPDKLEILSKYGVSFPEEFIDIFPQIMTHIGIRDTNKNIKNLKSFKQHLKQLRRYITKFSSSTIVYDLLSGNVCAGISSSDNIYRAVFSSEKNSEKIRYITPKECGVLWVDCICIPKFAPHLNNAYKLINYLFRPDICSKITEYSGILVTVDEVIKKFREKHKDNPEFCPSDQELDSFIIGKPSMTQQDMAFDKLATRIWTQIRLNNFEGEL